MASYKIAAVVAAILFVGATAQENTLAAVADLASNPNSAFVYVPQTSVTGEITVSCQNETCLQAHVPEMMVPRFITACVLRRLAQTVPPL